MALGCEVTFNSKWYVGEKNDSTWCYQILIDNYIL